MAFRTVIAACVALSTCVSASASALAAVAGDGHAGGVVLALNPQPEPPGRARISGIVLVALNPQPEPPGATESKTVHVALNPQPEPPGKNVVVESVRVALNPQPEPPGITTDARKLLPPGPCRGLVVKVEAPGAAAVTVHATEISAGRCRYDVAVPGARPGSMAKVTFSRAR